MADPAPAPDAALVQGILNRVESAGDELFEKYSKRVYYLALRELRSRADAEDPGAAKVIEGACFIYLCGSSPMHLRSVLKNSAVWEALCGAWRGGAVVVGSSGAAMALTDPMVDARGGGLTIGLGLLSGLAVVPHFGDSQQDEHGEKLHRSVQLAPAGTPVAGIPERTALIREPDGRWRSSGVGDVAVFLDGAPADSGMGALPA